jgi:hypothetical protein
VIRGSRWVPHFWPKLPDVGTLASSADLGLYVREAKRVFLVPLVLNRLSLRSRGTSHAIAAYITWELFLFTLRPGRTACAVSSAAP